MRAAPEGRLRIGPLPRRHRLAVGATCVTRWRLPGATLARGAGDRRSGRAWTPVKCCSSSSSPSPPHALRVVSEVGTRLPAPLHGQRQVLLAALPQSEAEALLPKPLERFTEHTITDRGQLLAEIERVRVTGVAYDREEQTLGVSARVGTLVQDAVGLSASITVVSSGRPLCEERRAHHGRLTAHPRRSADRATRS